MNLRAPVAGMWTGFMCLGVVQEVITVKYLPTGCQFSDQTPPYRSSVLVFYYTLHVSAVHISHRQVGAGYLVFLITIIAQFHIYGTLAILQHNCVLM
jgi:hypothetical protein